VPLPAVPGVVAGAGQARVSFREYVESQLAAAGFGLVPTRRSVAAEGGAAQAPVLCAGDAGQGGVLFYIDRGVVFALERQQWRPVSVEDLVEAARVARVAARAAGNAGGAGS
jgi:hypothetical protein